MANMVRTAVVCCVAENRVYVELIEEFFRW